MAHVADSRHVEWERVDSAVGSTGKGKCGVGGKHGVKGSRGFVWGRDIEQGKHREGGRKEGVQCREGCSARSSIGNGHMVWWGSMGGGAAGRPWVKKWAEGKGHMKHREGHRGT